MAKKTTPAERQFNKRSYLAAKYGYRDVNNRFGRNFLAKQLRIVRGWGAHGGTAWTQGKQLALGLQRDTRKGEHERNPQRKEQIVGATKRYQVSEKGKAFLARTKEQRAAYNREWQRKNAERRNAARRGKRRK
jgi:hypothetical protein